MGKIKLLEDKKNKGEKNDNIKNKSNIVKNNFLSKNKKEEYIQTFNKIKEYKNKINKDKFIKLIKLVLTVIIIFILGIYYLIVDFQMILIKIMELNLLTYYYNLYTRDLMIGVTSSMIQIYYDSYILNRNSKENDLINHYIAGNLTIILKEKYHNFTEYFFNYNLAIDHDFNLLYKERSFVKLRGFWQKIKYISKYSTEIDFIVYNILSFNISDKYSNGIKKDFENFLFFKGKNKVNEKVNTPYIKVLYYLCVNYQFVYRDLFEEIEQSIYSSYNVFVDENMRNYIILEIIGFLFYIIFFIIVFIYLFYSNNIIIKNIIFLFLDVSEKQFDKNKLNNNNKITLKLIEFQKIIDDFDINLFEKFSKNLDNINKNKYNNSNNIFNDYLNKSLDNNGNNDSNIDSNISTNRESKKRFSIKKNDKLSSSNTLEEINNSNANRNFFNEIKKKGLNNSSHNYLVESNSQFFKDKLNNNSINASNEFLDSNNSKNSSSKNKNNYSTNNKLNPNTGINEFESLEQESYQDILLNKTNKNIIFMIKIYFIIMIIIIIIIVIFIVYKFNYILSFDKNFTQFYDYLYILTNRYALMYYYFNIFRTLILFPEGDGKKVYEDEMETINERFEEENNLYNNILSLNINNYKEISKLFNNLKDSKNNSTDYIIGTLCVNKPICLIYLNSENNIINSGIDFTFKSIMTEISNIYMDYKKISNKEDIEELRNTLIYSKNSQFINIGISLNYFFIYLK